MRPPNKTTLPRLADPSSEASGALDAVLGSSREMVMRFTADGTLIYVNPIAEDFIGQDRSHLLGKSLSELDAYAGLTDCWQEGFEKVRRSRAPYIFICEYVNPTGKPMQIEAAVSADFQDKDHLSGVTMVCRDITSQSRKREQAAKMAARREFMIQLSRKFVSARVEAFDQLIGNALAEIGALLNGDRTYIFSYDFENEIINNTFEWCRDGIESHKDDLQKIPMGLYPNWTERHFAGHSISYDDLSTLNTKDPVFQRLSSQGIKSIITVPFFQHNKCIGFVGVDYVTAHHECINEEQELLRHFGELIVNLEDKRAYEEEKKLIEMRFKSIVERAFAGIYIIRNGKFEFANRLFCRLTGYTEQELKSEEFTLDQLITYKDNHAKQSIRERRSGDLSPKSYKVDIITKDGTGKTLTVNTTGIRDVRGVYTLGIAFDVSEVSKQQEAIQEINHALSQRNKELKEFAHITSHNLRAPVANIMGLLEHIDKESLQKSAINAQIFDAISECTSGMHTTLEDMLHILRTDQESQAYEKDVRFEEVLEKIKAMLSDQLISAGVSVESDFDVEGIKYHTGHLESFFLNMFTNAIRYRAEGRKPHIKVSSRTNSNGFIQLFFKDNGQGIDLNTHGHKIFKMYQSFHHHPDSKGVGLYLVKSQLDKHGGHIQVDSVPGEWTEFVISLKPFS